MAIPYNDLLANVQKDANDLDLYLNMKSTFKTWINNNTRLNATNMNELVSFIKAYSQEVGTNIEKSLSEQIESFIELNAGWKVTPDIIERDASGKVIKRTVVNGELFNDYQNNVASGLMSHAEGEKTKAISEGAHAQNIGTTASGKASSANGTNTVAGYESQFVIGKNNDNNKDNVFEVGWGTNAAKKNLFEVNKLNNKIYGSLSDMERSDNDLTALPPKGYVDKVDNYLEHEIRELQQLNEWLGAISVNAADYFNEEVFQRILTENTLEFTKDTDPPSGRAPRNGDQITVDISDREAYQAAHPEVHVPLYPEIWMFKDLDPKPPNMEGEDPTPGRWKFFSSLQTLINATKNAKGLVQVGTNIDVDEGVISIPIATPTKLGVVKSGGNITLDEDGTMKYYWNEWA